MPQAIVATIEKVTPISGTGKNGKPYTLYKILAGGQTYTSFNEEWLKAIGQERTIEYEVAKNGAYENRRVVDPKLPKGSPVVAQFDARLARMENTLNEIHAILQKGRA